MDITISNTQEEFKEITKFFGDMWKEEFNLDRYDRIDEYINGEVYYIREDNIIVSAIALYKSEDYNVIGRFGTLEPYRGEGYGTSLMSHAITKLKSKGEKEVYLSCDLSKIEIYEKFGFKNLGESLYVGNVKGVKMKKVL